jgi:CubicO group peptidase (beta-lactamase class C family)/peptidoglycan/LPS O-acetylase OafA/YrhL
LLFPVPGGVCVRRETVISMGSRDRGLDLLRALALGRVVAWHATGYAALTWVGALPVMVFLTGLLLGRSSHQMKTLIGLRLRRLLFPLWGFAVASWSAMIAVEVAGGRPVPWAKIPAWFLPLVDPSGTDWEGGWLSRPLWYLRLLLWLFVALPVLSMAARRVPRSAIFALAVATVAAESQLGASWWAVQDFVLFSGFFVAGLASAAGTLPVPGARWWPLAPFGVAVVAVSVAVGGLVSPVVNDSHTVHLGVGAVSLAAGLCALPLLRRFASRIERVVDAVAHRSLTIYLWHTAAIAVAVAATRPWLAPLGDSPAARLVVAAVAAVVCAAVVPVMGRLEDAAAHRTRPRRRPALNVAAASGVVVALAAGLFLGPAGAAENFTLPVPSQAPEAGSYDQVLVLPDAVEVPSPNGDVPHDASSQQLPQLHQYGPPLGAFGPGLAAELEALVEQFSVDHAPAGVVVSVVRPSVFTWDHSAGAATLGLDHEYPTMSFTKSFTAVLLLWAAEDGRIDLDAPVGTLQAAPWFTPTESVSYRQLLSHTSGLVNYRSTALYENDPSAVDGWEPALRAVLEHGPLFAPGERFYYSSTNYLLAGLAASEIYGAGIEELLSVEVLDRFGLSARVSPPSPASPNSGTAGVTISVRDTMRWTLGHWRDALVLGPAGQAELTRFEPGEMFSPGSMSYCPCGSTPEGAPIRIGIGYHGGLSTARYYPHLDVAVVLVSATSLWEPGIAPAVDDLTEALAVAAAKFTPGTA